MANNEKNDTTGWDARQVRDSQSSGTDAPKREGQTPQRRRRRRRGPMGVFLYLLCCITASAILAGVGWLLANDLCAFNKKPATVTIEVTAEDSVGDVTKKLKEEGLIEYGWFFRLFGLVANAEEKILPGSYEMNTDMDYRALIASMHGNTKAATGATVNVTIPEGHTVEQTLALLAEKGVNTEEALVEAAKNTSFDYDFIDNETLGTLTRLEGYLFPDTYEFFVNEKPASAINRLLKNFQRRVMSEEMQSKISASGRSLEELIIIASLIEKETDGTDQARIASVIYNRLKDTGSHGTYGKLQIDAALLYAVPDHTGPITNDVKAVQSPYNLYENTGLPPTAIANPGLASIEAAMKPESTSYYYYALGKDGKHRFFKTYNEHLNFVNSSEYASK